MLPFSYIIAQLHKFGMSNFFYDIRLAETHVCTIYSLLSLSINIFILECSSVLTLKWPLRLYPKYLYT